MKTILATLSCMAMLAIAVPGMADEAPTAGEQISEHLTASVPVTIDYLLYLPKNYDDQESWPLVLFLHGSGERGENLDLVKKHGPPKRVAEGKQFPFILVSPQCPEHQSWSTRKLSALLDAVIKKYHVDEDRVYVTGLSMGGYGTWAMGARFPARFAAIAPICGGGDPATAKALAKTPIWAFHGAKDPAVPVERSKEMVKAIKEAGGQAKLTIYPEARHDSWTVTYENPEFYKWLLGQELGDGDD